MNMHFWVFLKSVFSPYISSGLAIVWAANSDVEKILELLQLVSRDLRVYHHLGRKDCLILSLDFFVTTCLIGYTNVT